MDAFFDLLSFLPETIQPIIAATVIIVIGYFLSKTFAALIVSFIPTQPLSEETNSEGIVPLSTHLSRLIFWLSWLAFIVIGTNQVNSVLPEMFQLISSPSNLMRILPVALGACILIASEKHIAQFLKVLKGLCLSIPIHKDNFVFRFIIRFSWLPILMLCVVTLASPETFGFNATTTLLILLFGWLISVALKQVVSSALSALGLQHELISKFFSYFVFVQFLIAAVKVWV